MGLNNAHRVVFCMATAIAPWSSGFAQTAGSQAPAAAPVELETVVVTAERKSENAQRAPLQVTVLSGAQIESRGFKTSMDIQAATPGLTFSDNANFSEPYIRGVGTDITTPGAESSIATYVDGVYQASPYFGIQTLTQIDRVEVLKGPQGTLYGRNATGGVINIITKDPSQDFEAEGTASVGTYLDVNATGYLSVPIGNGLSANLAVSEDRHDGYGKVLNTGQDTDFLDRQYIHGKILYKPTDDFSFLVSAQALNSYDTAGGYTYFTKWGATPLATVYGGKVTYNSYDIYGAYPFKNYTSDDQFSAKATYNWNDITITSLTAYTFVNGHIFPEFISTNIPIFDFEAKNDTDSTYTEDLTISQQTDRFSWIIGYSYLSDSAKFNPIYTYSGPTRNASIYATVNSLSNAGFADLTYNINDEFSVVGGVRYTADVKRQARLDFGDGSGTVFAVTPPSQKVFDDTTYKAVLQYKQDWGMLYAKFETGFKAGGVNAEAPGDYIEPEKLKSYEVGVKSQFLNDRLRLNAAAFYYDYSNLQSQYTDVSSGASYFESAKKATVYGGEISAEALVTDELTMSAGLNFLHTRFDDFISNGSYKVINGFDTPVSNYDLSGNELTHSPPFTFNLGADWRKPLSGGGDLDTSFQYYFSSKYFFDATNREYQAPFSLVNGRVAWNLANGKTTLAVWGRNLLNQRYLSVAVETAFGDDGQLAPPLTVGVSVSQKL
jgi:iron complex outermembrane receptor protein